MFARLCSTDECGDDTTVFGGAVEDLFDGYDIRVCCCFLKELKHGVEGFIRVVKEDVLTLDGVKDALIRLDEWSGVCLPRFHFELFKT